VSELGERGVSGEVTGWTIRGPHYLVIDESHVSMKHAARPSRLRPPWQRSLDVTEGHNYPAATEINASALEGLSGIFSQRLTEMRQEVLLLRRQVRSLEQKVEELADQPLERVVELPALYSGDYQLKRPLFVNIEEYEGETLARWPAVQLTARGVAEGDALMNLGEAIIDLLQDLQGSKRSELGVAPLAWLSILESVIDYPSRAGS